MAARCILALSLAIGCLLAAAETVTVVPTTTHQTIEAWGSAWGAYAWSEPPALRQHLIEEWVDGLGLTRTRIETQGGNIGSGRGPGDPVGGPAWERFNDDGNPTTTDPTMLNTAVVDDLMVSYYLPFKQRVEANGDRFSSYFSASFFDQGSTGQAPSWLINSPGEHAEFLISNLLHLKNMWSITPDYTVVINEPGNQSAFSPAIFAATIRELGPRMQALGLPTRVQFAEGISAESTWNFTNALQGDPTVWPYVGMLSYHLYGNNDPFRSNIRDFGIARGIPRAQTEYLSQDVNVLYDDLTLGGVSVWELYGFNSTYLPIDRHCWFSRSASYWNVRQVTRYVRPGAVRVGATSSTAAIRPLAFRRNGATTVVLWNNSGGPSAFVDVGGLPPGTYGICRTVNGTYQEVGVAVASSGGVLASVDVPTGAIVTLYPHSTNLPPTMVDWRSSAATLKQPASTTTLTASAQDPELDPLTYVWSVVAKPAGTTVALTTPNAATTGASGMTAAGDYVFAVTVNDPTHAITRRVEVTVQPGNQPPEIYDCHNRLPVWVTLPTSGTTLRIKSFDLENDLLAYQWSVVSQPAGANVVLGNATTTSCTATNMTVAGNYVFRIAVSDATHTTAQTLTVPVFPVNQAPVIAAIGASPSVITLPNASAALSATTSDPDANAIAAWRPGGDVMTHWWSVKSAPAGAAPVFATPGSRDTMVSGLGVTGTYVFSLAAMDRTQVTSRTVTVTVSPAGVPVPEIVLSRSGVPITDGAMDMVAGLVAGGGTLVAYQITNTGGAQLSVGVPTFGSLTNCAASVNTAPAGTVPAGGSTTLTVMVTPAIGGPWSCPVSFSTNDGDENPTDWLMSGTAAVAPASEVLLSRGGIVIASGSVDTVAGVVAGIGTTVTYQIDNSGGAPLSVGTPALGLLVNCTASINTVPAGMVPSGGHTSLAITLVPTSPGTWGCPVSFATNDADENPTHWTLSGTAGIAPAPEIDLSRAGLAVADGAMDSISSLVVGGATTVTYRITNNGTAVLVLGTPSIGTLVNCTAVISPTPGTSVPIAGSGTLMITVTPLAPGSWSCPVSIATNDGDEDPTDWVMAGTATTPPTPPQSEIEVDRGGVMLADGGSHGVSGSVAGMGSTLIYRVSNHGAAPLTLASPMLSGQVNCVATVTMIPTASVAASASTTIGLTITPVTPGPWSFAVSTATNDVDEDPTDWTVTGMALASGTRHLINQEDCGLGGGFALIIVLFFQGMMVKNCGKL